MPRAEPQFQPVLVNKAGRELATASRELRQVSDEVLSVIGNWRAAHSFPLNTMKLWLLNRARRYDDKALVAQRLKRMSSIGGWPTSAKPSTETGAPYLDFEMWGFCFTLHLGGWPTSAKPSTETGAPYLDFEMWGFYAYPPLGGWPTSAKPSTETGAPYLDFEMWGFCFALHLQ
jgi:hypothetical protein